MRTKARRHSLSRTMAKFRKAVLARLKRLDWSTYRLVQELKGKRPDGSDVPPTTVYRFVRDGANISLDDLGVMFDVLGLRITEK